MPLHKTDIDGFKSDLYLLPYGPLEPMVINFTCDLSLVCIPPASVMCDPCTKLNNSKLFKFETLSNAIYWWSYSLFLILKDIDNFLMRIVYYANPTISSIFLSRTQILWN